MYKVFGCNGTTSNDVIIDAMARAFVDGVHIISMSIGGMNGWSEGPEGILASRIADRGVFMSIAAGNDGDLGLFASSSPAVGPDAIAVASVDAGALVGWHTLNSQNETFVPTLKDFTHVPRVTSLQILCPLATLCRFTSPPNQMLISKWMRATLYRMIPRISVNSLFSRNAGTVPSLTRSKTFWLRMRRGSCIFQFGRARLMNRLDNGQKSSFISLNSNGNSSCMSESKTNTNGKLG